MKKKVALLLACMMVLGVGVGSTLAWFTDTSSTVENTFTVGKIKIDLYEHKIQADYTLDLTSEVMSNSYNFVPGDTLPKDPTVEVKEGSEGCWLFIRVTEEHNALESEKIINWAITEGWTQVNSGELKEYYYREVPQAEAKAGTPYKILKDDEITVNYKVTKEMLGNINNDKPDLKFRAAAIQSDALPEETGKDPWQVAWENLPVEFTDPNYVVVPAP